MNPQAGQKERQGAEPTGGGEAKNDGRREEARRPQDPHALGSPRRAGVNGQWGTLPPKIRRTLIDADAGHKPEAWRERIEDYLKKVNEKSSSQPR